MPVCAASHVIEGRPDLSGTYDGAKLSVCARCRCAHYVDRRAQKSHWFIHKKFCSALSDSDRRRIDSMDLEETSSFAQASLQGRAGDGHEASYAIRRLRSLFDARAGASDDDAYVELHTFARGLVFQSENFVVYSLYSFPGIATLLLCGPGGGDDLLTPALRAKRDAYGPYGGRPSDDYVDVFVTDERERERYRSMDERAREEEERGTPPWEMSGACKFCYLYFNLLVAAAARSRPSVSSVHDGRGELRRGELGTSGVEVDSLSNAALRRAMELWTDRDVREACGDALAPAASLAVTALLQLPGMGYVCDGTNGCDVRRAEVVPGLPFDGAIRTCLAELGEGAASSHYGKELLEILADLTTDMEEAGDGWIDSDREDTSAGKYCWKKQPLWRKLDVKRRAAVARAIIAYLKEHGTEEKGGSGIPYEPETPVPLKPLVCLLEGACGAFVRGIEVKSGGPYPRGDEAMRLQVWREAASDETLGPKACGFNWYVGAFFHYLLRLCEKTEGEGGADMFQSVDMLSAMKNWEKLDDEEEDACLELSRGPEMHKRKKEEMERFERAMQKEGT